MLYDASVMIRPGMVVWPGDPPVEMVPVSSRSTGKVANVRRLSLSTHAGTHVDAPDHFVEGGKTLEAVALSRLFGEAVVLDVLGCPVIGAADLEAVWPEGNSPERVLLRTDNSVRRIILDEVFHPDFVALSAEGADWLLRRDIATVGIDYYSIEPYQTPGHPTHMTLLGQDILVIEGLNLVDVPAGRYRMACLPLRLQGADGGPARVVLETLGG